MSNFADPNGDFMNSKMNVVSTTSNFDNQMCNTPTYLLPSCQKEVPNMTNGFCTTMTRPPTNVMISGASNIMPPCQKSNCNIVPGNSWVVQEGSRYTRPAWTPKTNGVKKHKRVRTMFTSQQMMELEQEYARTRYLDRTRRIELAEVLHLNERTIKIWFQNRRMKEKKNKADGYDDSEEPSTTDSSPDMANNAGPVRTHDQMLMQYNVPNGVVHQGDYYMGQYPISSPLNPTMAPMYVVQGTSNATPNYPTFILDSNMQLKEELMPAPPQLRIENFEPCSNSNIRDPLISSPLNSDTSAIDSGKSDVNDQNWDLSWIRSINIDEEV
ncbi:protein zerknuellt 2-like isoform X2 [Battus philenor]